MKVLTICKYSINYENKEYQKVAIIAQRDNRKPELLCLSLNDYFAITDNGKLNLIGKEVTPQYSKYGDKYQLKSLLIK